MQSISFPRSPANFQTLPTELKDKVIQEVVTDALAPLSATSLGVQQSSSPATRLSAETIKRQSNKLNSLMMVNKDFMKLMLSYLRRHPDPKILHPLSWVALNSILRERNADTFNNMIRAFLEDCTYLDLSHRSVAPFMSGERVALIVNQLATIPAKHLQTAVLHFKEKKEWDDAKDKFAQIHQVNPEVLIHVSFPDNPGELSWPPSDLSTVLRGRENVKGVKVTQVSRGDVEDSAQFFTFLLSGSSVNELALQKVSGRDMEGLSATLLEPGCNLTALSLGKTPAGFWHEDFTLLASALANPASPVKKIQLHGPWSRENVIPFLTAAGHDNSLLKELDFSGVSNERRTFVLAIQDLVTPLAQRGITITLPD